MKRVLIVFFAMFVATFARAQEFPASEHPRLYLHSEDIPALRQKMSSEEGRKILRALDRAGVDRTPSEEASEKDHGFRYYYKMRGVTSRVQHQALNYLVYGNKMDARMAIESMLDTLQHTNFGRKQDLSRASGVMLTVGAMVYDWCYDQMTSEEKEAYVKEFVRIAGTMESGYPPKENEPIAGHCSEWMLLRDMLSCGIAIYDEYPQMFESVKSLLDRKYVGVRNYIYSGGNYHQGTGYVTVRFSNDMFCQWIMHTLYRGGDYFDRAQQNVMYDFIYRRRPDGQVLPAGDVNHSRSKEASYSLPCMLAASYYSDPYLQYEFERTGSLEPHCLIFRLLWQDFSLQGKGPEDLPLSRYSAAPFGWMLARTGWDENSVIAEMKVNEQFVGNHQHQDGGAFQIYYKGPLAIDTGYYQGNGEGYNSLGNKNYTKRTIAHNALLIYDPSEKFETWSYGGADRTAEAANDGGQRLPGKGWKTCTSFEDLLSEEYTVGRTLAHGFGPDTRKPEYTLLKGDITPAYSSAKAGLVQRSFVFLNLKDKNIPAALVVCDHVVSKDPSFKKTWLLHSIDEPQFDDQSFTITRKDHGDKGSLRCDVLFPQGAVLEKIGGPGKEMWMDGVNYLGTPRGNDEAKEYGQWRVEESPCEPALDDLFLNVMQVSCKTMPKAGRIVSDKVVGALVADRAVLFSRGAEPLEGEFSFRIDGKGKMKILATDLSEGAWIVLRNGRKCAVINSDKDQHAVYFEGKAGNYTFVKQ